MDDTFQQPVSLDTTKTVKKSNLLNELRNANASLVEYRLFCVYLAHLPMDSDNNVVTFTLDDYAKIAGLKRPRADDLEKQADNLLDMRARIPNPGGGFRKLNIFSEFSLFKQNEKWMVSLECTSNIAPLIREQGARYLRYKLYNTIFLKSYNQQRLYELLKQYQRIGERTISLPDLRDFLSIDEHQYPVWGVFARDVLKVSQQAIAESTDICFEFEPIRDNKRGKPVVAVRFTIKRNNNYVDRLNIEQHMPNASELADYDGDELHKRAPAQADDEPQMSLFNTADVIATICGKVFPKFTKRQIRELAAAVATYFANQPTDVEPTEKQIAAYINLQAEKLQRQAKKQKIDFPAAYLTQMIKADAEAILTRQPSEPAPASDRRDLSPDEIAAIQRDMQEPPTAADDPVIAARADELRAKVQGN